jgi:chemotaxis signal transduction protein
LRYLTFKLGNKTLALPGERVVEVVRLLLLGPAPGKAYMGSIPWREKTLAVLGPEALGVRKASPGFAIVTEIGGVPEGACAAVLVGFPADRATGIFESGELGKAPPGSDEWIVGVLEDGAWAIDPDRVITPVETAEAALLLGEEEFLRFCAKTLLRLADERKSRELQRAVKALEKELGKK